MRPRQGRLWRQSAAPAEPSSERNRAGAGAPQKPEVSGADGASGGKRVPQEGRTRPQRKGPVARPGGEPALAQHFRRSTMVGPLW